MSTVALIDRLKEAGEDFEWYPTTATMIHAVASRMGQPDSILDIGAGDGRVLKAFSDIRNGCADLYAIEKAGVHIEAMPANIAVVGTDFHGQTLIDKNVDVVFCNPPYSEYEEWATKIIREALCLDAFLVLPQRWADSMPIAAALKARDAKAEVIWSGDFSAADRPARAKVDVIRVRLSEDRGWGNRRDKKDPFDAWFCETFPEIEVIDTLKDETSKERFDKASADLVQGYNLVDRLAELYQQDMAKMNESYRALCSIDPALLKTVGVKTEEVKKGLRQKIGSLKNRYWQELLGHLDKVKSRLTHKSREAIVEKMSKAVHVDFTSENAYAVVIWVLKNANGYIDSQLTGLFETLTSPENIRNYKSNQKTWSRDRWRFRQSEHTHYVLEYRIIHQGYHAIFDADLSKWQYPGGLHKDCHVILGDIITVANNLGMECCDSTEGREWKSGRPHLFHLDSGEMLMRVKAYKNGNLHIQFNQGFIKALNVEASRLLGWIRTPEEACGEMDVDMVTAQRVFGVNRLFEMSDCKRLTA